MTMRAAYPFLFGEECFICVRVSFWRQLFRELRHPEGVESDLLLDGGEGDVFGEGVGDVRVAYLLGVDVASEGVFAESLDDLPGSFGRQ